MILVQDQYRQGNRKNFETELQLKQDTSKQLFSDPKEIWEINYGRKLSFPKEIWEISCEEELLTSGNDTDEEENFFEEPNGYQNEIAETRRQVNPNWKKVSKNVRFEGPESNYLHDLSETSSMENELADGGCGHEDRRRFLGPELTKMKEHSRMNHKPKWRTVDYYDKKYDRRPKSTPEKSSGYFEGNVERRPGTFGEYGEEIEQRHRMKRKEHRCGRTQPDVDIDYICGDVNRKPRYKFEYSDEMRRQHHGDCCNYRSMVDEGRKKNYLKSKSVQKHFCHVKDSLDNTILKGYKKPYSNRMVQDKKFDTFPYHSVADHYCHSDEYHEHTKSKKKILEAVQEQQEHFSDSTYKLSCPKFSNHTIPNDLIEFTGMRPSEKLTNSSRSDCMYWNGKNYGDKMFQPHRLHKMRSRRTRMNRLKNGWKKAFVQTVRDGSRNERVGVIVMGPKGPEFYSKNKQISTNLESCANKGLNCGSKSFEMMAVDPKTSYVSQELQADFASNDLPCPEDETKVDEKLENFSKNVNEIVKTSEEKFYKALSSNEYQEKTKTVDEFDKEDGERVDEEQKNENEEKEQIVEEEEKREKPPFHLLPFEALSPRVPKSLRKRNKKINEESKATADALNKQAKDYKENQLDPNAEENTFLESLKHLQEKFPPKEISEEEAKANLSLWGIRLENMSDKNNCLKRKKELGDGDDEKSNIAEKLQENIGNFEGICKNETCQTSFAQIMSVGQQMRKKYYEDATTESPKFDGHCAGDGNTFTQIKNESAPPKKNTPESLNEEKEIKKRGKNANRNYIISEMFRDLVENGCAISQEESENLQNLFSRVNAEACSNDAVSEISSEIVINTLNESKENVSPPSTIGEMKTKQNKDKVENDYKEEKQKKKGDNKNGGDDSESNLEEANLRRMFKLKNHIDEKILKKVQNKGKTKKKIALEDKMKILREALPSIAAENEAAHLKQLKKYIDRFIERVEASTSTECQKQKQNRYVSKDSVSTDSSEVRVDARKILDIVNNPFKTISSDVTINIAKKLTDALVQEKTSKDIRTHSSKPRKNLELETDEDRFPHSVGGITSGSDRCADLEPTYLKQLKKMRNEHLNNIVLEVKRLSELLRFLDRCTRLTS